MLNNNSREEDFWTSSKVFERIQFYADRKNWSLSRLASVARLSEATISSCRNTNGIPSVRTLAKICDALDITMQDLFSEEDNKTTASYVIREIEKLLAELKKKEQKEENQQPDIN